jgi:hypothetical protein
MHSLALWLAVLSPSRVNVTNSIDSAVYLKSSLRAPELFSLHCIPQAPMIEPIIHNMFELENGASCAFDAMRHGSVAELLSTPSHAFANLISRYVSYRKTTCFSYY